MTSVEELFTVNKVYSRRDIYEILNVPSKRQKGEWNNGYREYNGNIFIFSNIQVPGRTGHDYENRWEEDLFHWEAKTTSDLRQPLIQKMISGQAGQKILLFTRRENRAPFTYEGTMLPYRVFDSNPVKIIWRYEDDPRQQFADSHLFATESEPLYEGEAKSTRVDKYERNPEARRMCIKHFGCYCNVCEFDFQLTYGELGEGYIHVHHKIPISKIGKSYQINPIEDLIPLCPNCHSMVHRKKELLSPEELKQILLDNS